VNFGNLLKPLPRGSLSLAGLLVVSVYILLATAGALALSSCATTEKGLQREETFINAASNSIAVLRPISTAAPQPIGSAVEGILAGAGALLALWATHVHRSLAELKQSNGTAAKAAGPAPPPAG
jgi:hypothetical protein